MAKSDRHRIPSWYSLPQGSLWHLRFAGYWYAFVTFRCFNLSSYVGTCGSSSVLFLWRVSRLDLRLMRRIRIERVEGRHQAVMPSRYPLCSGSPAFRTIRQSNLVRRTTLVPSRWRPPTRSVLYVLHVSRYSFSLPPRARKRRSLQDYGHWPAARPGVRGKVD